MTLNAFLLKRLLPPNVPALLTLMQPAQCSPLIVIGEEEQEAVPNPLTTTDTSDSCQKTCSLDCCDLAKPTPARLQIDKESTSRVSGKRKRYFQNEWLQKYEWLVLCKTNTKAYCQSCRYALASQLQTKVKNGIDAFTSQGFTNWKKGSQVRAEHDNWSLSIVSTQKFIL